MTTILITGASSGLGAEMARQFAAKGHDLALCARRLDRLEQLKAEILSSSPERRIEVRALDVTDDERVFEVFRGCAAAFGTLDRIVVNAGVGKGARIGTGRYQANRQLAMTNFVAALCQTEAAMEILRAQGHGHLVMISSMSAVRGLPGSLATYAATKAGVAHLVEGLRVEFHGKPQRFTVLYPGYIASEMNEKVAKSAPMMSSTQRGVRAMVAAIEQQKDHAIVPRLPWAALAPLMRRAPVPLLKKLI